MSKNVETLSLKPKELAQGVRHCVRMGRPAFVWGPPGIGKSQILKQIAEDLGMGFVDIRLSQMDATDLRGIPYPTTDENGENTMRWAPPAMLPKDPNAKVLILLDEMNSAAPSIQAGAYQLVLDRRLGEYELPKGCMVIAAGNRDTDKGTTFKMAKPLQNRFVHLDMRHDFDDWQEWALLNEINKHVVGYLTFQKSELFEFNPQSSSKAFPTPRSWEFVSDLLQDDPNLPHQVLTGLIAGAVGDGVAAKFLEYKDHAERLPNPSDILSGKVTEVKNAKVSLCYSLTTGLCYELKQAYEKAERDNDKKAMEEWHKMSDRFLTFLMDNFQPEMTILGARTALALFRLPFEPGKMKSWDKFADKYEDLILKA
jgi:hypothetical protein